MCVIISVVNLSSLSCSVQDGLGSCFAETLMHQFLDERLRHLQATEDALLDMVEKSGAETVTVANVTTAITRAHPGLSPEAASGIVSLVFPSHSQPDASASGDVGKKSGKKESVGLQVALRKLRAGRLGPSDEELAAEEAEAAVGSPGKSVGKKTGEMMLVCTP